MNDYEFASRVGRGIACSLDPDGHTVDVYQDRSGRGVLLARDGVLSEVGWNPAREDDGRQAER